MGIARNDATELASVALFEAHGLGRAARRGDGCGLAHGGTVDDVLATGTAGVLGDGLAELLPAGGRGHVEHHLGCEFGDARRAAEGLFHTRVLDIAEPDER